MLQQSRIIDKESYSQMRMDAINAAKEVEGECWEILSDLSHGRPCPRADSLEVSESIRHALRCGWADPRKSPNEYAIEDLARRVVADSHLLKGLGWRVDSGNTRIFATMLKQIIARKVPTLYTPNMVRSAFPIRRDVRPSARTYAHHRIIEHGELQLITPDATEIPTITVSAEEDERRLVGHDGAIQWSIDELQEAALAMVPLQTELLAAMNNAAERNFEIVGLQGHSSSNIVGMYNDANVSLIAALTGTWSGATQAQILADIRNFLHTIKTNSESNYTPNRLIIPEDLWVYLGARNVNTDRTVMELLMAEFRSLSIIEGSARTNTYDAGGTGPRIMAFYYDEALGAIVEARPFTLEPAEKRGWSYRIPGRNKLGGASIHVPLTFGYMDGC